MYRYNKDDDPETKKGKMKQNLSTVRSMQKLLKARLPKSNAVYP